MQQNSPIVSRIVVGVVIGLVGVGAVFLTQGDYLSEAFNKALRGAKYTKNVPFSPPFTGPKSACTKPYHTLTKDGKCFWNCRGGSRPNGETNKCVCEKELTAKGKDGFGRVICK